MKNNLLSDMGKRKQYDSSFKENAVKLSFERENISELARELGIETVLIYRWRREYTKYDEDSFSGNGKPKLSTQEKDIIQLKASMRKAYIDWIKFIRLKRDYRIFSDSLFLVL